MQKGYQYTLTEKVGRNFDPRFKPELTPKQMLSLGVFGGKYMTDCKNEFPSDWYTRAKLCSTRHDAKLNFFGVNASQPLSVWQKNGWIYKDDPRGWFQWYCRYFMGRRLKTEDDRQIKRWIAIKRHIVQVKQNCKRGDISCRPKQRQAILHWAYDSRNI
jgi:ribosomal protein L35